MRKRIFCLALCAMLFALSFVGALFFALSLPAEAQQPKKVHRIGYLFTGFVPPQEFLQGLRGLGYVEGQNIVIEYRGAEGKEERLPELAADLVRLKVDIIVAPGGASSRAAKNATKTIPIIIMQGGDPVALGLVDSLAQPGGNVTGVSEISVELTAKRLELLKETFPKVSRVAVLIRAANRAAASRLKETEVAAKGLGMRLQPLEIKAPNDFDKEFQAAIKGRADALIELPNPLFHSSRQRIVEFAAKNKLPSIFHSRDFVDAGGLMCYGASNTEMLRRVASFVDKILKGRKPAELPVEQPMKFELIINLKTAKQIGLAIPPLVLYQADRIIK